MRDALKTPAVFCCKEHRLPLGLRTWIMGIVNVTPDSFSDGGCYLTPDDALRRAEALIKAGADILDIGGESTRPGGVPVEKEEELRRVLPVVTRIAAHFDCPVSIDTSKPEVARAALEAGACIVNDVTGFAAGEAMAALVAETKAGAVLMHNARLYRDSEQNSAGDPIKAILTFWQASLNLACQAGIASDQLILDPGIGFGVTTAESLAMIRRLPELKTLGLPILIGPSRKRFIGEILQVPAGERLMGTAAAVAVAVARGADFVRVHDVQELVPVIRMADAICRRQEDELP